MLKRFAHSRLRAFEKDFGYDAGYMHELVEADVGAVMKFMKVQAISGYRKNVPEDVWYAAKITGAMHEDCGPCTQLAVTMAERANVSTTTLRAIAARDDSALPEDVRLGVEFSRAVLARDARADKLREEIVRRWGFLGLVSIAFTLIGARVYPTLKYALGHGHACTRLHVAGEPIPVRKENLVNRVMSLGAEA